MNTERKDGPKLKVFLRESYTSTTFLRRTLDSINKYLDRLIVSSCIPRYLHSDMAACCNSIGVMYNNMGEY